MWRPKWMSHAGTAQSVTNAQWSEGYLDSMTADGAPWTDDDMAPWPDVSSTSEATDQTLE